MRAAAVTVALWVIAALLAAAVCPEELVVMAAALTLAAFDNVVALVDAAFFGAVDEIAFVEAVDETAFFGAVDEIAFVEAVAFRVDFFFNVVALVDDAFFGGFDAGTVTVILLHLADSAAICDCLSRTLWSTEPGSEGVALATFGETDPLEDG